MSVFAEPLAQARKRLTEACNDSCGCEDSGNDSVCIYADGFAALDLIEQRATELEAENGRLRETLARLRPDIDPDTGYGHREAV